MEVTTFYLPYLSSSPPLSFSFPLFHRRLSLLCTLIWAEDSNILIGITVLWPKAPFNSSKLLLFFPPGGRLTLWGRLTKLLLLLLLSLCEWLLSPAQVVSLWGRPKEKWLPRVTGARLKFYSLLEKFGSHLSPPVLEWAQTNCDNLQAIADHISSLQAKWKMGWGKGKLPIKGKKVSYLCSFWACVSCLQKEIKSFLPPERVADVEFMTLKSEN